MEDDIRPRMGTFFLLIGTGLLILFVISDVTKQVDFNYFFWGALTFGAGFLLQRASAPKPKPSNRFSGIRKIMAKKPPAPPAKKEEPKK
jgi:hypothetical protein